MHSNRCKRKPGHVEVGQSNRIFLERQDFHCSCTKWPFGGAEVGQSDRISLERKLLRCSCAPEWTFGGVAVGQSERMPLEQASLYISSDVQALGDVAVDQSKWVWMPLGRSYPQKSCKEKVCEEWSSNQRVIRHKGLS
ncbi:hypothetical protein QOT17_000166 [Balamuthia mandrillaris]